MNKFKAFFTFFAFTWLSVCGIGAVFPLIGSVTASETLAWMGVVLNALALPIWILLRYLNPQKLRGDLRESGAFAGVLIGLALTLLTDSELGLPIYLVITNLFVFLLYLYHLSSVSHPEMTPVNAHFPDLTDAQGRTLKIADFCAERRLAGAFVVFLRGSYCADSRSQLYQLPRLLPELRQRNIGLVLCSAQPASAWPEELLRPLTDAGDLSEDIPQGASQSILQLADTSEFIARQAAPLMIYPWIADATRPSVWLVDESGIVLWRELTANYRTPAGADLLRAQWFRLQD